MKKSNLDEMQEQKLLRIEHNGFWLAYTSLLIAILVQAILGCGFYDILGELVILLVICAYMVCGCLKHGIWDRWLKPSPKTNLLISLAASVFSGVVSYSRVVDLASEPLDLLLPCLIAMAFTFVLCFAALSLTAAVYKKRRKELDNE